MKPNINKYTKTEFIINNKVETDLRLVSNYLIDNNLDEINSSVYLDGVKTDVVTPIEVITEPYNNLGYDDFNEEDGVIKTASLNGINNNTPNTFIKA